MEIRTCCYISLESSQRVVFNAIKKKNSPLSSASISRAPKVSIATKRGGFHLYVRTILNPKFEYSVNDSF
ncbi:hypothetical protein O3M35_009840 [Rhynocoris fuscipes]|uniref:Uncharacterized protein n=1 Tax=Rhynocoris fuscipes TaxID=488301 RepID=A0AAW1D731_9HEMI